MTIADELQAVYAPVTLRTRVLSLLKRRATWILFDQGIVSIGNFLTITLLGRHLPEIEFGVYGLLFETMNYLNGLQWALVIYPMTIKGATGDHEGLGRLATASVLLTLLMLPILGGAIFASLIAVNHWNLTLGAIAAMLLWQLQETLRRAMIADLRIAESVWGDAVSYLGQALLIAALGYANHLTLNLAFIVMAGTSAAGILLQAVQLGLRPIQFWQLRAIGKDFWRIGRWMLLTAAGPVISTLGYWWTLRIRFGLEECGLFLAIVQFFKLANPVMNSMSGLILPSVARAMTQKGSKEATRVALRYSSLAAGLVFPYFIVLALFAPTLLNLFYPGKVYVKHPELVRMFIVNYTIVFLLAMINAWLAGLGKARYNFYAQSANVGVTLIVGLPLTALYGVKGLIIGGGISAGVCLLVSLYLIRKATSVHPTHGMADSSSSSLK